MTNLNATALHAPGAARAVARTFAAILGPLVRVYRARRQAEHLESFSDHLLADIGISRGDIDAAVRWGEPAGR